MSWELDQDTFDSATEDNVKFFSGSVEVSVGHVWQNGETITVKTNKGFVFYNRCEFSKVGGKPWDSGFYFTEVSDVENTIEVQDGFGTFKCYTEEVTVPPATFTLDQRNFDYANERNTKFYKDGIAVGVGVEWFDGEIIEVRTNKGWKFSNQCRFYFKNNSWKDISFDIVSDSVQTVVAGSYSEFACDVEEDQVVLEVLYKINSRDFDTANESKVTFYKDGNIVGLDSVFYSGEKLVVKVSGGVFDKPCELKFKSKPWGAGASFDIVSDSEQSFIFSEEVQDFSCSTTIDELPNNETSGLNNCYVITKEELKEITEARFKAPNIGSGELKFFDYGQYIINLVGIPFDLDLKSVEIGRSPISLADYKLDVEGMRLSTDVLVVDFGEIKVDKIHNNYLDYKMGLVLHLPYVSPFSLDIDKFIGFSIEIKYNINLYNGVASIDIYSTKTGEIVVNKQVDLGVNIPFANSTDYESNIVNNSGVDVGKYNGVDTPFIEIFDVVAMYQDDLFNAPILDVGIMETQRGFVRVENINLNTSAMGGEVSEILDLLSNGVIIND